MIKVLLDENVPHKLKWSIDGETVTVPEHGWGGVKNGELLGLASKDFDVLLTMDQGIAYQQNLKGLDLCIVLGFAKSNDIDDLLPLIPSINRALQKAIPGKLIRVDI